MGAKLILVDKLCWRLLKVRCKRTHYLTNFKPNTLKITINSITKYLQTNGDYRYDWHDYIQVNIINSNKIYSILFRHLFRV